MARQEMPIFVRTFDMLAWLLPATNHFPRPYRHSFTQRLLDAAFDLSEALHEANLRYGNTAGLRKAVLPTQIVPPPSPLLP